MRAEEFVRKSGKTSLLINTEWIVPLFKRMRVICKVFI